MKQLINVIPYVMAAALTAAGIVGVAREWSSAGVVVIFVIALLMTLIGRESHRVEELVFSKKYRVKLGRELETRPATTFEGVSATYAFVHNQLGEDPEARSVKIDLQDALVGLARKNAFTQGIDRESLHEVLRSGTPPERVLAFGVMTGDPSLADTSLLLDGICRSRSGNEQYHALKATEAAWEQLNDEDKQKLAKAIREAPYVAEDTDRRELADQILQNWPVDALDTKAQAGGEI